MSALLLDTNIIIALVNRVIDRIPRPLFLALRDRDNRSFASVASIWEIAIKHRLGKLDLLAIPSAIPPFLEEGGVTILPVDTHHALAFPEPVPNTQDPFDRLLLGICAVEQMKLITTDRQLAAHPLAW